VSNPQPASRASIGCAASYWLRSAHQTQATGLLIAANGNNELAAKVGQVLGFDRVESLMKEGKQDVLAKVLKGIGQHVVLTNADSSSEQKTAAVNAFREATSAYAAQVKVVGEPTASVGEPSQFPVDPGSGPPKPNAYETFVVQKELAYKSAGGMADRAFNRRVYEPWDRYVAQPTKEGAIAMYERFAGTPDGRSAGTPVGRFLATQASRASEALTNFAGQGTPIGNVLRAFDEGIVKNERLWEGVDKAGAAGRKIVGAAAGATLTILANGYRTGALRTGTFNTSGKLTPEQLQMVKGVNIPPNINVRYYTVPTMVPVTVKGQTFNIKGAATIVVGDGSNVVFLPALGPGKPGAQPWFGPVQDGGPNRDQKQLVSASSSVAAAKWEVFGFSIGTSNFNVGGRADLQVGRGLLNIFAAQSNRGIPPTGQPRNKIQSIVIGDVYSTFHTATINVGPLALVVDRVRNPQNERITVPNGRNSITFGNDAHSSSVQPAVPLLGASTWDPREDDVQMLLKLFGSESSTPQKP
jgi:hypothetical protein